MKGRLAELEVEARGAVIVAGLVGEVDSSNARELLAALSAGVPADASGLTLDLSELRYLDSSGVQLIFTLASRLGDRRQRLAIVIPEGAAVARVLDISGVVSVAMIADSVDAALERLNG